MASAWSQLDQLLTCAICLDRYRNPKLLPCQHTFCMDPCLEGLIDYARRQIKCPECRAEHRIPYQGVQAFPTNVTLVRFLELHRDITGEEPEPPTSMMERCTVCSEKSYLERCAHCDKKICQDCREAHADVLRREINRINNQVRRGLSKLSDALSQTQKNADKLKQNCRQVKDEIEELVRRYSKDLKDTEDKLKHDLDVYIQTEMKNITKLKDDLDVEVSNINSNCELVDKYISDTVEWSDSELVEYKDIFLKTLEFLRNFDPDTSDFSRKVRFEPKSDPDILHRTIADFGEIKINAPFLAANLNLAPPHGNALMRSQSDHRLASQFQRRQEGSRNFLDVSQRFAGHASDSERESRDGVQTSPLFGRSRRDYDGYRRYSDRNREDYGESREVGRSRFLRDEGSRWRDGDNEYSSYRSRYSRDSSDYSQESEHHSSHTRTVRFEEPATSPQRERVIEIDESTKGPLSGIARLLDSSYVLERLRQNEIKQKQQEKEKEKASQEPAPVSTPAPTTTPVPQPPPRRTTRQLSEDDIEKQKRQNQLQARSNSPVTSPTVTATSTVPASQTPTPPHSPITEKPVLRRVAALQKEEEKKTENRYQRQNSMSPDSERLSSSRRGSQQEDDSSRSRRRSTEITAVATPASPQPSVESPTLTRSKSSLGKTVSLDAQDESSRPTLPRVQEQREEERKLTESPRAIQSSFYGRLSASRRPEPQPEPKEEPKVEEEDEDEDESEESESESESESEESSSESSESEKVEEKKTTETQENSSSTSSESEEEEQEERSPTPPPPARSTESKRESRDYNNVDTNHVSTRNSYSSYSRSNDVDSRNSYGNDIDSRSSYSNDIDSRNSYRSKWWEKDKKDDYVPRYLSNPLGRRKSTYDEDEEETRPYSRFLARSRSSALLGKEDSPPEDTGRYRRYSTAAANLRRNRIAKSKSSHDIGFGEESAEDDVPSTPTYGRSSRTSENSISRSRSHHAIKSREPSPEEDDRLSWSKYLRNKYGTGSNSTSRNVSRSKSSHAIYSRSASENSSEDEYVPINSRRKESIGRVKDSYLFSNPRSTYVQKKRMVMKIGTRGTDPGKFTWPRGVSIGPDNIIVVADSSNHRVQVFDHNGKFLQEFGSYGSAEGEFDCLAGVVVNRIGQFIVSDRYNHRIQVFDPSGRFLRSFGCEGRSDGRFSYPWGITTDSLGFIYICDKENHRVQVFQSDGTFVGKFGTIGTRPGQLEHPHYIAVTNTNRVVVSDTNNHRVQVFDVNGRSLSTFGTEGSEEGQFKFPRGIAVDDQGYIIVGDSGNNRIQIFHPDGTFLKSFGTWGSSDGEFKGLEGIAVTSSGNIFVCDRENHRIQMF
ncbi:RING finger protein nhl-1-like [Centruroides sculpturatus]|uniref:RING finger protein nhl-1-like n=1 Tax=Centruroides sculpturatus TaxID=218467 RepID=UPI000C6CA01B|nr:RING finger protein nhl-1-like [Centruroides sculpturatus]XP_023210461.1 RING finger protein nhl-1-like [Centruroides sculpturatus]XP_023210463.1 RING finger protein nhl-1-like [Centruroides sculpturatus]XP_023210464.1 RING finger protein nhl-1-like [Centruroides sculpturatus]